MQTASRLKDKAGVKVKYLFSEMRANSAGNKRVVSVQSVYDRTDSWLTSECRTPPQSVSHGTTRPCHSHCRSLTYRAGTCCKPQYTANQMPIKTNTCKLRLKPSNAEAATQLLLWATYSFLVSVQCVQCTAVRRLSAGGLIRPPGIKTHLQVWPCLHFTIGVKTPAGKVVNEGKGKTQRKEILRHLYSATNPVPGEQLLGRWSSSSSPLMPSRSLNDPCVRFSATKAKGVWTRGEVGRGANPAT